MKIEFCIETETAAKAAQKFGADRIELCQSLDKDGLTPSQDLIKRCKNAAINFHAGTPKYRGIGSVNFTLYNDEKYSFYFVGLI